MRSCLERVRSGLVVFDGGTGMSFQDAGLTTNDFGGPEFDGCMEILNVARPEVVESLHRSLFDVEVGVVETNTFRGFAVPLAEYGPEDRSYELSAAGAAVARGVADEYHDGDGRLRFTTGSVGPCTKFATHGQITYRKLRDAHETQVAGLIDGGVDLFVIEAQFDLLEAKAAMNGAWRAMQRAGVDLILWVHVTIELTGRMLGGTETGAALTRSYVECDLRSRYEGPIFYGKDAFTGLGGMQGIVDGSAPPKSRRGLPDPRPAGFKGPSPLALHP